MTKFRRILSILLVLAMVAGMGVLSGCGKSKDYPDYKNPLESGSTTGAYDGKYTVSVTSMGGLRLDGVTVTAHKGSTSVSGISRNGVIDFTLPEGEYELTVDESTLPDGYYVPEDADFKTTAELATAKISLPSRVIPTSATSGTRYSLGDVMHDFGFTATDDVRYRLSDVLASKKAVVLNFWFATCVPCQSEFPAIQKAFSAYADKVDIIALTNRDDMTTIRGFREEQGLTFLMGPDQAGVTNLFGVDSFPTTVIIDRYGVVAHIESGSIPLESTWKALFNKYASDNYTQEISGGNSGGEDDIPTERDPVDPSLKMPSSGEIAAAINGTGANGKVVEYYPETNEKDAPYSWPWLIGSDDDGSYAYASNEGRNLSFSILYCKLSLKTGDIVSYSYNVNTEDGKDILYVLVNGKLEAQHSGNSDGWKREYGIFVADHDTEIILSFCYQKDQLKSVDGDKAMIKNITVTDVTDAEGAVDQKVSVTDGLTLTGGKYPVTLIAPGENDNDTMYYKAEYTDGDGNTARSFLFTDMLNSTPWNEKHASSNKFTDKNGQQRDFSLYNYSFWMMSNEEESEIDAENFKLKFDYGDEAVTETIIENYYLQTFSSNGLLPITNEMKTALEAFTAEYCEKNNVAHYTDQWLELCYIYKHFGEKHLGNQVCARDLNPILGLNWHHAIQIEAKDRVQEIVNIDTAFQQDGGGMWYSFTPASDGVYLFRSELLSDNDITIVDPAIRVHDCDGNVIRYGDSDIRYDSFTFITRDNFYELIPLKGGQTYRVQACMHAPGAMGSYKLLINRVGDTATLLRTCVTAEGMWVEASGGYYKYGAIEVGRADDGYYHAIDENRDYASVIYIDMVRPNFYDQNDHSLYEIALAGYFNIKGKDYTQTILSYYNKSIEGKSKSDELYGLIEADQELVDILNALIGQLDGDGARAYAWLMFASYYHTYGPVAA